MCRMKNQKKDCFTFVPGCNWCNTKINTFPFFEPRLKMYPNEPCWRIPHVLEVCKSWIITTQPPARRNPGSFSLFKGFENNDQWSDNNYNTTSSPTKLFMNQTPFQNYDNNDTRLYWEEWKIEFDECSQFLFLLQLPLLPCNCIFWATICSSLNSLYFLD